MDKKRKAEEKRQRREERKIAGPPSNTLDEIDEGEQDDLDHTPPDENNAG